MPVDVAEPVATAQPPPAADREVVRFSWPHRWPEQERLLERQHDGLKAALVDLCDAFGPDRQAWSTLEALAYERACRRLLWDLRLHLRLEERWLQQWGCLCPGHRQAHRDAAAAALAGLQQSSADRHARWSWLRALQDWFSDHRAGPDAHAYVLAHLASSQP